jgi:hypothetical protein
MGVLKSILEHVLSRQLCSVSAKYRVSIQHHSSYNSGGIAIPGNKLGSIKHLKEEEMSAVKQLHT